jgi:hypothetical protein
MRSPMIEQADYITDKDRYSDMQVLRSAAGYYVGTLYHGEGLNEPGSRDSEGYFKTRGEAEAHLADIKAGKAKTRMTP